MSFQPSVFEEGNNLSEHQLSELPQKKERLACFGFALGLVFYFVFFLILNVIPNGYVVIEFMFSPFKPEYQFAAPFVYMMIWSIHFSFIKHTKITF